MEPLSTRPTAQEFDLHTAWMRRLARALVDDASAADDVVQDAWAKLAPRQELPGAGYLAAVVRSLAWSRHRSQTRRNRREAASARPEALPSAAEVSARVEIARRVAEALQELPEPYRTTLVLRYYDDLSAAQIARREGVPAATVRSRLKRGLETLRERLDRRSDGRAGWMAALVPFTRSEAGAPGALFASASTLLALKLALAGLCAALSVALAWRFVVRDGGAEAASAAIAPELPAEAVDDRGRARGGIAGDSAAARTAAAGSEQAGGMPGTSSPTRADTLELTARALDDRNRPLAGAWLELDLPDGRSAPAQGDGRMAFAAPAAALERLANADSSRAPEVRVGAPGRRTRHLRPTLEPGAIALDLGDVRLDPGAALAGRVVDESGLGVEDALIVFDDPNEAPRDDPGGARAGPDLAPVMRLHDEEPLTGRSGPGGAFRLEGLPAGHGSLWARSEQSLWSWTAPIGLRAGDEVTGIEIVVRAAPERVITGRVVDPEGAPVPQVALTFRESQDASGGWWNARTDERGRFHFVPREGRLQDLHARAPDSEWDDIERANVAAGTHDLQLAFAESAWLAVEARAADGRPLRDGRVRAVPSEGPTDNALPRCESTLDAGGRARLRRPDVALRVLVEAPSYRSALLGPFEPDAFPVPLIATLEPLPALQGQVFLPDGSPAAGARVSLHRGSGVDSRSGQPFQLTHQGWGGDGEPFVHRLHVEPLAAVTTDEQGRYRLPLPGVDARASEEVERDTDGLAGLGYVSLPTQRLASAKPQQPWYVHAATDGEATLTSGPHTFATSEERELELRLPRGGAIEGRLLLDGGLSPAGWTMSATDGLAEVAQAAVDRDGSFRFDDLHAGGWQLRAFEPGRRPYPYARMATQRVPEPDVQVEAGLTARHDHRTGPRAAARLSGRLWIDGSPPGPWRVSVSTSTPQAAITTREATLDPDGRFEVRLQPGLRTWLALHGSIAGTRTTIDTELFLQAGDNDWTLELWTARIEGNVDTPGPSEGRHAQPQHQIDLGDVRIRASLRVDEHGRLEPVSVAAGRGVLRGPQRDMREPGPIWTELELAPGETRVLDLR